MPEHKNKFTVVVLEFIKWGAVIWLLWPLLSFQTDKMSLWRMVFGVMLAVILLGKMFYDFVLDNFKQKKEHYTFIDLLILVGFITMIAVLIGGAILVIGLYLSSQWREAAIQ